MLKTIRSSHPKVPIVCITPIFSSREFYDDRYIRLSQHTRKGMRQAVAERIKAGDEFVHLVEGLDLLGKQDTDTYHEGVHPTDLGYQRIAERLQPILEKILFEAKANHKP